ncbi:unnamed protein product [Scytosiphon promiscuus]
MPHPDLMCADPLEDTCRRASGSFSCRLQTTCRVGTPRHLRRSIVKLPPPAARARAEPWSNRTSMTCNVRDFHKERRTGAYALALSIGGLHT